VISTLGLVRRSHHRNDKASNTEPTSEILDQLTQLTQLTSIKVTSIQSHMMKVIYNKGKTERGSDRSERSVV
jgi:hypothetical protein